MATIDATDTILGRLATYAAKKALLGENVEVINCEKAIVTGNKHRNYKDYQNEFKRGTFKGPFIPKQPHLLVKRTIRGMLPHKQARGREALKRIRCHIGTPETLKEKAEIIKEANVSKLPNYKYTTVGKICGYLGWTG